MKNFTPLPIGSQLLIYHRKNHIPCTTLTGILDELGEYTVHVKSQPTEEPHEAIWNKKTCKWNFKI